MKALHWAVLLSQALAPACAALEDNDRATTDFPTSIVHGYEESGHHVREPGADHVEAAHLELAKIRSSHTHHKKKRKPGMLGWVLQYAWKAVPSMRVSAPPSAYSSHKKTTSGPLQDALSHLEVAAKSNNSDALFLLGQFNYYGNYSHPRDYKEAMHYYSQLAALNGNSSAQYMMGLMYSTGIGGIEQDQAKALLYYTFAAMRGHIRAEMTIANRHWVGIGTPKSCDEACKYYKRVAEKVIIWYRSGPPGGMSWARETTRVADDVGGLYGEGASASSSGINAIHAGVTSDAYASIDDIIEYLDLMSNKGDFKATFNLGRIYYEGQRGLERDLGMAKKYFSTITKKYWKSNGRIEPNTKPGLDKVAAKAAGYIGRMFMRGEGVMQDFDRAKYWFERGIALADAQCQHGLGLMLLHGYGVDKNLARATDLFKAAADQDYAQAQVELALLFLDRGAPEDIRAANEYFELAARTGHIEAQYYLAELTFYGIGRDKACAQALGYYKSVAEKAEPLVSSWSEANQAYDDGDYELALLGYLHAAEEGYETAQNNVAYLLDPTQSMLSNLIGRTTARTQTMENPSLALIEWTRSSKQGNVDSLVKMGDYYLNGVGTKADVDKSVKCYTGASEYQQSAQALYNLGWLHENGIGLDQDFHLAKRYYDLALETNEEAYLPVTMSLLKLRARSAWNTLTHGKVKSIQDEPAKHKDWSLGEWIANFIQDDREGLDYDGREFDDIYDDDGDDGMPGGDGAYLDGEYDDEGPLDIAIIIGLATALAGFLWYRYQGEQAERERRRREQDGNAAAGGGGNAGAGAGAGAGVGAGAPAAAPPAVAPIAPDPPGPAAGFPAAFPAAADW